MINATFKTLCSLDFATSVLRVHDFIGLILTGFRKRKKIFRGLTMLL
jgi:hypothetical protein